MSLGFTFGVNSISEEVVGFSPYGFPKENICVHCLLCLIVVLVILSYKILRSYSLNIKIKTHFVLTITFYCLPILEKNICCTSLG